MNILNFWQRHPKNKTYQRRWLIRAVAATLTCLLILAIGVTTYAEDPSAALIVRFRGNGLNVRSGTNRNVIPVTAGQRNVLENPNDVLYVPGDNRSRATFALAVTQVWEFGGLLINTIPSNMPSQYTFPCRFGGRLTIGWRPQGGNRDRACNQGATVGPVRGQNALLPLQANPNLAQSAKEILKAQANEEVLVVPSDDQTVIKTADTGNGITVDVVEGDVNIKSAKNPQGRPVKAGERYSYPQDTITPINRNDLINSPEMQDFLNPDNWLSPEVPPRMANGIAEQLGQHRVALGSPSQSVASNLSINNARPLYPVATSGNYLKIVSGSGRITQSQYPIVVPVGTNVSQVTGGYDPSTQKITLEIEGRQAEISLNSPLREGTPITFTVTRIIPRVGDPSNIPFSKLVKDALIKEGIESQGTLIKQGSQIRGEFTSRSRWRFDREGVSATTGAVNGEFVINLEPGSSSDIPQIKAYSAPEWYEVVTGGW